RNYDEHALYYSLRSKLLWFCDSFDAYLTSLVLAPGVTKMRADLRKAADVDAMIAVHSRFLKEMIDEACLGSRLDPIRECILDLPDMDILRGIQADFGRHLRFIAGGLRGVARASSDTAAGKWEMLAERLEMGVGQ